MKQDSQIVECWCRVVDGWCSRHLSALLGKERRWLLSRCRPFTRENMDTSHFRLESYAHSREDRKLDAVDFAPVIVQIG